MEPARRDSIVARIVSGCLRLRIGHDTFLLKSPTREQRYVAQEVYDEVYQANEMEGAYTEDELIEFLLEQELWDEQRQSLFTTLPKEIEEFKVKLFSANFKSNERKVVRKALSVAKSRLQSLHEERHAYNHLSCNGAASVARTRFLLGCGLYYKMGTPVFTEESFWEESADLLDEAIAEFARLRLSETDYRDLARNDPWRTIWTCRKSEGTIFGVPPCDYTEEQQRLVGFSSMYEVILEHPECPGDEVVQDDDMLDGWMILQRRDREKQRSQKDGENTIGNEKIRNSQEVYLMAETREDAKKIDEMNDPMAMATKRQRLRHLREQGTGTVNELDMPDTRLRLRMELAQRLKQG